MDIIYNTFMVLFDVLEPESPNPHVLLKKIFEG